MKAMSFSRKSDPRGKDRAASMACALPDLFALHLHPGLLSVPGVVGEADVAQLHLFDFAVGVRGSSSTKRT